MSRPYTPLFAAIRGSKKLAELDDASERLYTRLLTQCDDHGRHDRDATMVNSDCWPRLKKSDEETERCLLAIEAAGLIETLEADGVRWIQVPDWDGKAGGVGRKDHRHASVFPDAGRTRTEPDGLGQNRTLPRESEIKTEIKNQNQTENQTNSAEPAEPASTNGRVHYPSEAEKTWQLSWALCRQTADDYELTKADVLALNRIAKKHGPEKLRVKCDALLTDMDPWVFQNASPTLLVKRWSNLGGPKPTRLTQGQLNVQATASVADKLDELEARGRAARESR